MIRSGADLKTIQTLARHSTLELTMRVYAKAVDENLRKGAESVGNMIPQAVATIISPESDGEGNANKTATPAKGEGYEEKSWCRRQDVA